MKTKQFGIELRNGTREFTIVYDKDEFNQVFGSDQCMHMIISKIITHTGWSLERALETIVLGIVFLDSDGAWKKMTNTGDIK